MKVFWSWQSDRIPKNHHYFVRDALQEACNQIATDAEVDEGERPEVDHDTKNVSGTPDIVKAIAEKIDAAAAFVADMTPVAVTDPLSLRPDLGAAKLPKPKHVQNANVMSELGYAEKAVGLEKIILVANATHYPGPDALPFDWRNRRGPITYSLADDADNAARRAEQTALAAKLREPLRLILRKVAPPPLAQHPFPSPDPGDPALWDGTASGIDLNEGRFEHTIKKVVLDDGPRIYVKIVPSGWTPLALSKLEELMRAKDAALWIGGADATSGKNGDGFLSASGLYDEPGVGYRAETVTQWFQQSGVFWAADTSSFGFDERGHHFAYQGPFAQLAVFIDRALAALTAAGAAGPFSLDLGASKLKGASWPGPYKEHRIPALKDQVTVRVSGATISKTIRNQALLQFWNELRDAFGLDPARDFEDFQAIAAVSLVPPEAAK